ncbi:glycerate kinase [Aestuariivivens sediminis]|uniref:glycerate kinase n=1 Tax=Aestuariivivens sediminis TaxID=2913557 RepID=UPI001F562431|nr:glycerate kinase [Aestuariivivens sediminis]
MRFVLAPDKFKGSITGLQFCEAVEDGIRTVISDVDVIKLPLADGGDGTIEVVNYYLKGEPIQVQVNNPFFQPVTASYLYAEKTNTAFIEMAEASGLKILKPEEFDCKNATSLGTGELIRDAMERGANKILLGIGGSATNDCGMGMAMALGYRFLDKSNNELKPIGANLFLVNKVDSTNVDSKLHTINFKIACDVTNPLYGEYGAAKVYAKQKGATLDEVKMLDHGLQQFSRVLKRQFNVDVQSIEGAGAAGGMGVASKVFLNGTLQSGIELIKDLACFDESIKDADWIITGEGKLDLQTLSGKTIQGVRTSANSKQIKLAAFCGVVELNRMATKHLGIHYIDAVMNYAKNLDDAMENTYYYIKQMASEFAKKVF